MNKSELYKLPKDVLVKLLCDVQQNLTIYTVILSGSTMDDFQTQSYSYINRDNAFIKFDELEEYVDELPLDEGYLNNPPGGTLLDSHKWKSYKYTGVGTYTKQHWCDYDGNHIVLELVETKLSDIN